MKKTNNKKKINLFASGLYGLCCARLIELKKDKKIVDKEGEEDRIIEIADVHKRLCSTFSAREEIINDALAFLKDTGLIERSNQGIKLNFQIENIDSLLKKK